MIIQKVTFGKVVQQFDTDTRKFTSQEFIGGGERYWEDYGRRLYPGHKDEDAELIYGKGGVDEPKMEPAMVQPPKQVNHRFKVGDEVLIVPGPDSLAAHEFVGRVIGFRKAFIQVKDQDDKVFDCDVDEVKPAYEA